MAALRYSDVFAAGALASEASLHFSQLFLFFSPGLCSRPFQGRAPKSHYLKIARVSRNITLVTCCVSEEGAQLPGFSCLQVILGWIWSWGDLDVCSYPYLVFLLDYSCFHALESFIFLGYSFFYGIFFSLTFYHECVCLKLTSSDFLNCSPLYLLSQGLSIEPAAP